MMFWFRKIPYHLPKARGPFVPGCMDVCLDYSRNGLFFRLYYPTDAVDNDEENCKRWQQCLPDINYILGLSKVTMLFSFLVRLVYWKSGPLQSPVLYGEKVTNNDSLKCLIFSHGLGAQRTMYSTICAELASRGFLVAAIEHRDESACHTYFYKSKEDATEDKRTFIRYRNIHLGKDHYEKRQEQVQARADECSRLLDFLINLNKGKVPHNIISNVPSNLDIEFRLEDLVGKLDMENLVMAGHSFGAATALLTLSIRPEFKLGVLLDPWMFPIRDHENLQSISQSLIFINTQTFHIEPNVKTMEKVFTSHSNREMYTILHTTHENQADAVFWAGYWLNWFMKKIDPLTGLLINNSLILRFLKERTDLPTNVDDCCKVLNEESANFISGLTKAWA